MLLVSPAEPAMVKSELDSLIKGGWTSSLLPEKHGVDFAWYGNDGMYGVQRKELKDFVASISDGRLQREVGQMQKLNQPMVLIEGKAVSSNEGVLLNDGWHGITQVQYRGVLWSLHRKGINTGFTANVGDTVKYIVQFAEWSRKESHNSLDRRPNPTSQWGVLDNEDYAIHILQGLPGVGPGLAKNIYEFFEGVPFKWAVTIEELMMVPGIGKTKAEKIYKGLQ